MPNTGASAVETPDASPLDLCTVTRSNGWRVALPASSVMAAQGSCLTHSECEAQGDRALANRNDGLLGGSPQMRNVAAFISKVARVDSTVLIVGETGTGKEAVARAIHRHSRRGTRRFVAINCATLSESLLESTLFGHRRRAPSRELSP